MKSNKYLETDNRNRILIAFGKYEGEFLADVAEADPGYLRWVLRENDELPDDVRDEITKALE